MKYKSQLGQDQWVIDTLKEKREGVFVDIGGGHPVEINNTYVLEKEYGWTGISLDIGPPYTHGCGDLSLEEYKAFWSDNRDTPIICGDALKIDLQKLFEEQELPKNIDYLTIDLEPPKVTYQALLRIPFQKYTFNIITFETDYYRDKDPTRRELAQKFLKLWGYDLKRSDHQEDWYVRK